MIRDRRLAWIALGAFALRLVLMVARGDYIVYDEGFYLLLERSLRAGHGFALNGLPHVALSPLQPVLVAAIAWLGVPDLWASRLLAAACGALLVFPVAGIARRLFGERAALVAAAVTVAAPALMSFVPFFPGVSWNLYFGSEPLFVLLVFGALAAGMRAAESGAGWYALTGVLAAAAFLTRAEGVVVAPVVLLVLAVNALRRRPRAAAVRGWLVAAVVSFATAAPYLLYLHSTLGRWAYSGRVQARATAGPAQPASSQRGGRVLDQFIWGGDTEGLLEGMSRLTPDGLAMQSQYWGVRRGTAPAGAAHAAVPAGPMLAAETASPAPDSNAAAAATPPAAFWSRLARGLGAVMPWWLALLGAAGLGSLWRGAWKLLWLVPPLAGALVPAALVYVEPRSLLLVVPLAAIGAAAAWSRVAGRLGAAGRRGDALGAGLAAALVLAAVWPELRDLWGARGGDTPLQQVATAQRAVGEYLGRQLRPGANLMSYHPAIAIWARRDWRVLPYEPMDRVVPYAASQEVGAIVLSRFHSGFVRALPRAFTAILLDSNAAAAAPPRGGELRLTPVSENPLLFVGRLTAQAGR